MGQDGRLHVSDSTVVLDKPGAISSRATVAQFRGCSKLLHVSIPATVSAIGAEAFMGCAGLRSVSWPRAPPDAHIGFGAFANCEALTKLILPATLRTIGVNAFANAMALTLVDIPDNVRCSPLPPAPPPPIQSLDGRARGKGERGEIREVLRRIRSIFQTTNNLEAPLTMIFS